MGFRDASGKEKLVVLTNALVRFTQIIVAAAALGVYGTQKGYWLDHGLPSKITFDLVVASLALITAVVLMILPFFLSYRPVALAAPWDFILMVSWGIAFGLMKAVFMHNYNDEETFKVSDPHALDHYDEFLGHWKTMMDGAWVNLAVLALFLISGTMGVLMWCIGRRAAGSGRGGKIIKAGTI